MPPDPSTVSLEEARPYTVLDECGAKKPFWWFDLPAHAHACVRRSG